MHQGNRAVGVCIRSKFDDGCDALPAADAHREERVPAAGPAQLVQGLDGKDGIDDAQP